MKSKLLIIIFALVLPFLYAQEEKPETALSLEQLLELVQQGKFAESEEATEREQKFARERSRQATLLANAKAERSRLEAIATELESRFEANDAKLVVLEEQLKTRLGSLYETFGHLQGVASDTQQQFESAVTSDLSIALSILSFGMFADRAAWIAAVSYTHLTLPTN